MVLEQDIDEKVVVAAEVEISGASIGRDDGRHWGDGDSKEWSGGNKSSCKEKIEEEAGKLTEATAKKVEVRKLQELEEEDQRMASQRRNTIKQRGDNCGEWSGLVSSLQRCRPLQCQVDSRGECRPISTVWRVGEQRRESLHFRGEAKSG
eukprot:Gb_16461 [translate_table: standard]